MVGYVLSILFIVGVEAASRGTVGLVLVRSTSGRTARSVLLGGLRATSATPLFATSRRIFLCFILPTPLPTTPLSLVVPVPIPTTRGLTLRAPVLLGFHGFLSPPLPLQPRSLLPLRPGFLGSLCLCFEDRLVVVVRPTNDLRQESFVGSSGVSCGPGQLLYAFRFKCV